MHTHNKSALGMDGLKGLQVKMFVPVDVSMDSTTNIFTYYKMINLKIFGRALFELWLHCTDEFYKGKINI